MRRLAIGFALLHSTLLPIQAQQGALSPPARVQLEVRARSNQRTFRIGEIIPLELRFSCAAPGRQLDARNYDRSGRLDSETYAVEPRSGWRDPLYDYFHTGNMAFIGGGLGASRQLSAEPFLVTADLNEWVRFDQAGEYRVTVTSRRVSGGPAVSNPVPLTIVEATPEWQEETLTSALSAFSPVPSAAKPRGALRTLRFLGTPAAARELATCLDDIDCVLGLAGSPSRGAAREAVKKALQAPGAAAYRWAPHLMEMLTADQRAPDDRN